MKSGWWGQVLGVIGIVFLTSGSLFASPSTVTLSAGVYEGLLIGLDPSTLIVTGYFHAETGEGQFRCLFSLAGKVSETSARINTFDSIPGAEPIPGKLRLVNGTEFTISLKDEHGGCWNVEPFADPKSPADFVLTKAYPWTSVRILKAPQSYLFESPHAPPHLSSYLVKGQAVGVSGSKDGWLHIDYTGDPQTVTGWLPEGDFEPLNPPPSP